MSLFGGGSKSAAKTPTKALGIDFQGAQYGPPIPVVYGQNKVAGNCIWYGDFQAIAVQQKQSGGKGGGGSSSTTSYDYKASYQLGICEGPGSIVNVYNGTSTVSLSSLGAVTSPGTQGQAPWVHLTGSAALGYSGTVLVSFQNRDLGSSASLPNDNFEVAGLCQFGSGIVDANPAAIINDLCTNPYYGIGFSAMGSLTQYSNYCVASGIFLSPVYDQQQTAQQTLSDLFKYTNADAWFSEGVLKIGCYADQSITGNGATYTPTVTAVANLTADDFITNGSDAPVSITRKSPADAMNIERLEYVDRANTYHTSAVTATIDNDVVKNGARSDQSDTFHGITNATVARLVAQNILQRNFYVRNQYTFQLSWRYCYLEPFDIVTLTDINTGLSSFPVRLLSVEEDEHGLLKLTAEEFPLGIGHGGTYATTPNSGTTVDPNSDPGPVASPYLFRGPGFLVSNNKPEIWCAVTGNGNALWAGCDVYLSHDGTSYTFLSTYARQARYGETTNSMGVQADPDTISAPNVVLNGYNTQLLGGSQADADNFTTLAMIDNEIIAYETATLAGGPSYTLGYLRRGGYGSTIAAHSAGAPFVRLDDGILRIPVDPSQIGQTIYIKFLSRNCFGRTPRTLASETAYTYVVGTNVELPDVPNVPDNFVVQGVADGVSVTWTNDNPAAVGCTSIERATASGGPWNVLAQVGPTTTAYHDSFTNGATYYYRARARGPLVQSGWSTYTDVFSSTGVDVSTIANTANTALDQLGNLSNSQYLQNPFFSTGDLTGWTSDHGSVYFENGGNGPSSASTTYAVFPHGTASEALRNAGRIPVYPGAVIKAQCAVRGNGTPNGTCGVRISWRDSTDTEIGSTPTPNPSTGNATNGTYVTGTAPAGAMFAHVEAFTSGRTDAGGFYSVDNFAAWALADTLDQVPDGVTRFGAVEAGADKTSGKPLSSLSGRTMDYVGDSATRFAAAEAGADKTAGKSFTVLTDRNLDNVADSATYLRTIQQSQAETVDNANFEASTALPVPGWTPSGLTVSYNTATVYAGTQSLNVTASAQFQNLKSSRVYKCAPGEVYYATIEATGETTGAWAFGLVDAATGNVMGSVAIPAQAPVWNPYMVKVTIPSGIASFQLIFFRNTAAASNACVIDNVTLARVRSLDNEVQDGTTYGRVAQTNLTTNNVDLAKTGVQGRVLANIGDDAGSDRYATSGQDLISSGGVNRVGLRIAGSGHTIGDQRNLQPITWASQRSVLSNSPISYSISGTTVTFSVAAVTLQGGGISLSYAASSGSVTQATGTTTTWFLYYLDPTQSGGSLALHITTNPGGAASFPDSIFLGTAQVTVNSGGGGTGGTGGGGGGYCVADDMFIGEGRRAGDAEIGDPFDCIDLPTQAGKHVRALQGVSRGVEECVRMITSDGCALVCSVSTPFDLPDGRNTTAPHMLGEQVITDLGVATVISLALVGPRPVTRAHLGGVSYAAGSDPARRIYSHNLGTLKP